MKITRKIIWYAHTLGGESLTDSRGNRGAVEARIRTYAHEGDTYTEQDAIREESIRVSDASLTDLAGRLAWDEEDIAVAVGQLVGGKVSV